MYLVHRYNVAKLNRLHQIFWSIIIKVTGNKNFLENFCDKNYHSYSRDPASYLMNSEIAILFVRFAIKHSL